MRALAEWCQEYNLSLNVNKTKELIGDFRRQQREHAPYHINGPQSKVKVPLLAHHQQPKMVNSQRQGGEEGTKATLQPQEAKDPKTLTNFYRCTIESILLGCITAWYSNCTVCNRSALQRVVRSAQRITRGTLPAIQDIYSPRYHKNANKIIKAVSHPSHSLFTPLPSRRRRQYRCIKAGTERLRNSFYLHAIRLLFKLSASGSDPEL